MHPYDDPENEQWRARFGQPYVEDDCPACDLDEMRLQQLEEEFHRADDGATSPFGDLETLDEDGADGG